MRVFLPRVAFAALLSLVGVASASAASCIYLPVGSPKDCFTPIVPVDPATGQPTGTTGTAGSSQAAPLYASESAASLATSQTPATTTASVICPARTGRRAATIENLGTTQVWLGSAGVTAGTGALLPGAVGASATIPTSAAIYGVVATGSQAVSCLETF